MSLVPSGNSPALGTAALLLAPSFSDTPNTSRLERLGHLAERSLGYLSALAEKHTQNATDKEGRRSRASYRLVSPAAPRVRGRARILLGGRTILRTYPNDMTEFEAAMRAAAAELGLSKVALLYLHNGSTQAQSIMKDIGRGQVAARLFSALQHGNVVLLGVPDASRLLRLHCGAGGAIIAAKIDRDDGSGWDFLNIGVLPDDIEVFAMRGNLETFYAASSIKGSE